MAQAPFTITPALVAIALDYSGINRAQRGYIADAVAPRLRVDSSLFRYPLYKIEEAFTVYDNQIDRLGRLNEIVESATETSGATIDYGLLEKLPYRDEKMATAGSASIPFPLKARAVRNVIDKNQLAREIRVAGIVQNTANYTNGYTVTPATKWSDYNNSDPVATIMDAQAGMLVPANVGVTSLAGLNFLKRHPKIHTALGGAATSGRLATIEEIAQVFNLERIIVGNTLKQTSKRGQALTTGPIWGNFFALHYQGAQGSDGLSLDAGSPNFLTTFQFGDVVSGENPYRQGEMGLWGGVGVLTGESIVEKVVAPFAGYLFSNPF
jgi:hypothetical protein